MSITGNILDRCEPLCKGWSRNSGQLSLLALLQEGQDELRDCDAKGLVWRGTENEGWPPYLTTVASTYRYSLSAAILSSVSSITKTINGTVYAVRPTRVRKIFIDTNSNFDFDRHFMGEPYIYSFNNPFRTSDDRVEIAEIPVHIEVALENDLPVIEFPFDPGASTDLFFCEFFWEAPRLTAETIPICVPTKFYPALVDYVVGRVSQMDNGRSNERIEHFFNGYDRGSDWVPSWKEQFQEYMDSVAQESSGQVLLLW